MNIVGKIKGILESRSLRYGSNSILLVAAVIAIALLVNLLAERYPVKFDLTADKLYSIGDITKDIIGNLDQHVVIYGLFDDGKINSDYQGVRDLLDKYESYSKSNITAKYVDPDKDTKIIKQLDPDGLMELKKNDFVVTCGGKNQKLSYEELFQMKLDQNSFSQYITGSLAEQAFTGAIKYVASGKTPVIYFAEGHGEGDLQSGYVPVKETLEKNNYLVKSVNLMTARSVPDDAGVLVFLSPRKDLSAGEKERVEKYLDNGGKAAFLFDYVNSGAAFEQFEKILYGYNLTLDYDRIKENDEARHTPDDPFALLLDAGGSNIIPLEFSGMLMVNARSIGVLKNDKKQVIVSPLLTTGDSSVGEQIDKTRGNDKKGPLNLAVAVEKQGEAGSSKILVAGSAFFLSEDIKRKYMPYFSNGMYFFTSAINWMQDRSGDVIIGPKPYHSGRLRLDRSTANVVGFLVILALPLSILGCGLSVWMRRRYL
ncbi:MAG: ABC-type uncharacterized transport system [Pelotomaculum sp. PtaU1.Bin035]|nr:MAG: ABC-type uncharacterized transport system [Pelotomaculum sp. PtaU1.Bin035]